jgi:hypothetical protein
MTTITCKIPEALDARLDHEARRLRTTKSALVRKALVRSLRASRHHDVPSAMDLVRSLAGCLRGPRDLSGDPRYLEDLGA